MSTFENVAVVKAASIYFEGSVTSRSLTLADGSRKSLGVMLPGEYEFGTAEKEIMEIYSGELDVLLPEATEWRPILWWLRTFNPSAFCTSPLWNLPRVNREEARCEELV